MRRPGRRHLALFSLLVLIPAAIAAAISVDAWNYVRSQPFLATDVARGEVGRLGDVAVELLSTRRITGNSSEGIAMGVPEGAEMIVATLGIDPGLDADGEPGACELALVSPSPAGDRRWEGSGYNETSYSVPDRYETQCVLESGAPYELQSLFLIPAGATADGYIEFTTSTDLPRALRLR